MYLKFRQIGKLFCVKTIHLNLLNRTKKREDSQLNLLTVFVSVRAISVFTATDPLAVLHGRIYLFGHSEIHVTKDLSQSHNTSTRQTQPV